MASAAVPIRLSYLLCPDLTPSMKLVWLSLRLDKHLKKNLLYSPTRIQRRIGITRPTIRRALRRLRQPCFPKVHDDLSRLSQLQVRVHPELITNHALPAMARVLYCILLGLRRLKRKDILSSYAAIAKAVGVQPRTVRRAMQALESEGWLAISQENQKAPLHLEFPDPQVTSQQADIRRASQRLEKSKYYGEALALLWCDALVESTNYKDDYYPPAFTNPLTKERLQADRYYFDQKVAIEFNGPQHDGSTERFSAAEAKAQMERDRIKKQISRRQGIALIALRPEDLTFKTMKRALGAALPLKQLTGADPLIRFLERRSQEYRKVIARIRRRQSAAAAAANSTPNA